MDLSGNNENKGNQNKENISNGVKKDGSDMVTEARNSNDPNTKTNSTKDKKDKSFDFEIVNEEYKTQSAQDIEKAEKKKEEEDKEKDKDKKKKKKHKKKDKRRGGSEEDPGPTKKVKTSVLDNKNIPEELRQKCYEIEKNPLAVAVGNIPLGVSKNELLTYFTTLITSLKPDVGNLIF